MRFLLFWTLTLAMTVASAGVLENCRERKQAEAAVQLCVETAQLHSTNALRKLSVTARSAVRDKTRNGGHREILREYRRLEARHVRERNTLCRKHAPPLERSACVADMNDAHSAQLQRFIE